MIMPGSIVNMKDGSRKNGEVAAYMVRKVLILWPNGETTRENIDDVEEK